MNLICCFDPQKLNQGRLFLGNVYDADDLVTQGNHSQIQAVLTVGQEAEVQVKLNPNKFAHLVLPIYDHPNTKINPCFDEAFKFLDEHLEHTNVLVHCFAGRSRSATIIIAYLMKRCHFNFQTAFDKVKEKRPIIQPNQGFINQLKELEKNLQESDAQEKEQEKQQQ